MRTVTLNTGDFAGSLIGDSMDLQQAQQNDDDLRPVIAWLKAGTDRPSWKDVAPLGSCTNAYWAQWSSLQLVDGVLYRLWETPEGDNVFNQWEFLRPFGKQSSVSYTAPLQQGILDWVNCQQDVQDWCHRCDICAERAPMKQYIVGSPMERLALDILGPLPVTDLRQQVHLYCG